MQNSLTTSSPQASLNTSLKLFFVSLLSLYLELLFIRWIGTEIRIFAYLQNTVLVVCFMGIGIGCLRASAPVEPRQLVMPLFWVTVLLSLPPTQFVLYSITNMLSSLEDFLIWSPFTGKDFLDVAGSALTGLCLTFAFMLFVIQVFIPIGQLLGRIMNSSPKVIAAYSLNVGASLFGVLFFVSLSALRQPPHTWLAGAALFMGIFLDLEFGAKNLKRPKIILPLLCLPLLGFVAEYDTDAIESVWSPYQKLVMTPSRDPAKEEIGKYTIHVNNINYQEMLDLSDDFFKSHPEFAANGRPIGQYDAPTLFHPHPEHVLIVGAGSGNDTAGALRNGAGDVISVDIDPGIVDLGKRYHPEKPYDSSKNTLVINDARAFFSNTHQTFDLIVFGLLDSHTMTSMSNARLDHYVYTKESFERAKSLLKPGGVMVVSFYAVRPFLRDRLFHTLRDVFESDPLTFFIPRSLLGRGGAMFVIGDSHVIEHQLETNPRLRTQIDEWKSIDPFPDSPLNPNLRVATDDWPYIYLTASRIPTLFYLLAVVLLSLFVFVYGKKESLSLFQQWDRTRSHFFFLGAAFLLLEVQNISKAAVVLGNTWQVSAVIISAILVFVLLANMVVSLFPKFPTTLAYVCLITSCIGLYFVDLTQFGVLEYSIRAIIVGFITTLPMFFSGIVFIRSFSSLESRHEALGANLFGSVFGAILQALTFVVGIKALLLVVTALYFLSWCCQPPRSTLTR